MKEMDTFETVALALENAYEYGKQEADSLLWKSSSLKGDLSSLKASVETSIKVREEIQIKIFELLDEAYKAWLGHINAGYSGKFFQKKQKLSSLRSDLEKVLSTSTPLHAA
jgi:hypothetical protein